MKSDMADLTKALRPVIGTLKQTEGRAAVQAAKAHLAKELSDRYRISYPEHDKTGSQRVQ